MVRSRVTVQLRGTATAKPVRSRYMCQPAGSTRPGSVTARARAGRGRADGLADADGEPPAATLPRGLPPRRGTITTASTASTTAATATRATRGPCGTRDARRRCRRHRRRRRRPDRPSRSRSAARARRGASACPRRPRTPRRQPRVPRPGVTPRDRRRPALLRLGSLLRLGGPLRVGQGPGGPLGFGHGGRGGGPCGKCRWRGRPPLAGDGPGAYATEEARAAAAADGHPQQQPLGLGRAHALARVLAQQARRAPA